MLTDDEIMRLLREAYTAVKETATADPEVALVADTDAALDLLSTAGNSTRDFLTRFRQEQARRWADDLPGYDNDKGKETL